MVVAEEGNVFHHVKRNGKLSREDCRGGDMSRGKRPDPVPVKVAEVLPCLIRQICGFVITGVSSRRRAAVQRWRPSFASHSSRSCLRPCYSSCVSFCRRWSFQRSVTAIAVPYVNNNAYGILVSHTAIATSIADIPDHVEPRPAPSRCYHHRSVTGQTASKITKMTSPQ